MLEEIWWAIGWKRKINRNGDSQTRYRAIAKVVFTINKLQMGHRHFHLDHLFGLPHLLSLRTSGRGNARMSTPWVQVAFSSFLFRRFSLAVLWCSKGMRELQAWSRGNPRRRLIELQLQYVCILFLRWSRNGLRGRLTSWGKVTVLRKWEGYGWTIFRMENKLQVVRSWVKCFGVWMGSVYTFSKSNLIVFHAGIWLESEEFPLRQ